MGITGLLPFLKKASRPVHVKEFSNSVAAIDVYCWIHKGAFGCAEKLVLSQPTDGYIVYVMKYVDLLLYYNIKPVLVFDGKNLPSKAGTEKKRRENRKKYKEMAKDHLREGRTREARECFQRCVDITPSMAREVIQACQERGIDCIVAPYEADAQLAWLNLNNLVDLVISEDSDLALFGCKKIIFKMDVTGNGTLYDEEKLNLCLGTKADQFSFEKFRYMCIMSGCDYLASLPGIGLGKSMKFWSRVTNPNLRQVLPKIPSYLNMASLNVTQEYIEGFIKANDTFLYQVVFDVKRRALRPLNDYPEHDRPQDLSFAGDFVDEDQALQLALGNVDIHSMELVHDFDPEDKVQHHSRPKYGKVASHVSVWSPDFDPKNFVLKDSGGVYFEASGTKMIVKTAFGDLKKPLHKELSAEKKRKRSEAPDSDTMSLSQEEEWDYLSKTPKSARLEQSVTLDENESPEKLYVSQYFGKKKDTKKNEISDATGGEPKTSGSWLDELDKEQSVGDRLIYRTDKASTEENAAAAGKKDFAVLAKLPKVVLRSSPASSQEFKPVRPASSRLNPFVVKRVSPAKSPLSELTNTQSSSLSPVESMSGVDDAFIPEMIDEKDNSISNFVNEDSPSGKSRYFSQGRVPAKKPKAASGLLKRKSSEKGQRSLLDMWKKS